MRRAVMYKGLAAGRHRRQSLNAALNGFSQLTASTIPRPLGFDPPQQLKGRQVRDCTH